MKFLEIDGLDIKNSNLPSVIRTPEGIAIGHIPGWQSLFDANYYDPNRDIGVVLDRVQFRNIPASSNNPLIAGTEGARVVDIRGPRFLNYDPEVAINPKRWTIFTIYQTDHEQSNDELRSRSYLKHVPSTGTSQTQISFSAASNRVIVYGEGGNTGGMLTRLSSPAGSLARDRMHLIMVTFSVENGLKIFINANLTAENSSDTTVDVGGVEPGEYQMHRNARGIVGMTGILDVDLGAPESLMFRKDLEAFLMQKYSIAP